MQTEQTRERMVEDIRSKMRLAFIGTHRGISKVIVGGGVRMFINLGSGAYFVFERLTDGVLRHAYYRDGVAQPSFTPNVESLQSEWDQFLADALDLARKLGLEVIVTEKP